MNRSLPAAARPTNDDLAQIILRGASRLGIALGREPAGQLVAYLRLIDRWNATYNLTAVRTVEAMATQHIVDAMTVISALRVRLPGTENRILDVGAGAGLPGVVIAILEPDAAVVCVDSVGKKTAFVSQVAATLGLQNLSAVHSRVEAMTAPPSFGVVVSRAFSSLQDFVSSTRHLLAADGWWIAMKGKLPRQELIDAKQSGATFDIEQVSVPGLDAERCLILGRPIRES